MLAESSKKTIAEEMAELGLSRSQVYRIRAKERDGGAEWQRPREKKLDRFDYPYMELVAEPPTASAHEWCKLEPDDEHDPEAASLDRGKVHIGGRVESIRFGLMERTDDSEPKSEKRAVNGSDRAKGIVYVQT
jgi:hypothetical protein